MSGKIVSRQLERAVIKTICSGSPSAKKLLSRIDESFFGNPVNKLVYKRLMVSLKNNGDIISWRGLTHDTALPEAAQKALLGFTEKVVINKSKCEELYKQLATYRRRRLLHDIAKHINDTQLSGNVYDEEALLQQASDLITNARSKKEVEKPLVFGKNSNYKEVLEKIFSGNALPTIPTGFKAWDDVNGGIVAKTVTLLLGYTGSMKSTLAEVLASNFALSGASVGQLSLEMSQEETLILRSARLGRVDRTEIIKGKLSPKQQDKIKRELYIFNKKIKRAGGKIHTHTPKNGITADDLFLSMEIYGYDVLIIDYVSLILGMMDGKDFWQKLMAFTARAKQFANTTNCRVIILGQSTKENELKLSKNMQNDADLVLQIKFDEEFKTNDHLVVEVPKARKQNPIDFPLKKEGQFANICDADEGTDIKIVGKMNVKNKRSDGSKAFENGDSVQTRGSKQSKSTEDQELEEYFSDAAIE